ncbi:hypothetical protein WICMUC_003752 [Wickerhamomyces mucosus]|uniref:Uncharacterized protein n=1 Tax=Wickerhamomyces mucosus TaxID=1378264 RepID=A0A9P8PJM5_9ASCO|nr:hypothetical protein WICMUC_003752 [Wickerhamomyces mucosus]
MSTLKFLVIDNVIISGNVVAFASEKASAKVIFEVDNSSGLISEYNHSTSSSETKPTKPFLSLYNAVKFELKENNLTVEVDEEVVFENVELPPDVPFTAVPFESLLKTGNNSESISSESDEPNQRSNNGKDCAPNIKDEVNKMVFNFMM